MASKGSLIFVINIIFGLCIGNLWTLNAIRPVRSIVSRRIPIRPFDRLTMQRLSLRPTELNPDAEPIFLPNHLTNPRPLQIMERISVPVDWNHSNADKFNVLNFDAYLMKPNHGHSLAGKPVTERNFRMVNQTDMGLYRGDTRTSQSQYKMHRSKNTSSKKQKKPLYGSGGGATQMKEVDDLEFYRAYLEQQKPAAMMKRMKPRTEPNARLPISGLDYFDQKKKNRLAFPPINYAPHYMHNLQRAHHPEDVEASNVQTQHIQMQHKNSHASHINHQIDDMPAVSVGIGDVASTPNPSIPPPTTIPPDFSVQNDAQAQTITLPPDVVDDPNESEALAAYHSNFASEPEMYRFTIDDVVFKPPQPGAVAYPFTGPVTLPPPITHQQHAQNPHFMQLANQIGNNVIVNDNVNNNLPVNAKMMYENQFDPSYQSQLNYPPKSYVSPRLIRRRPERYHYKHIPIEGASTHQQMQKYSIDPAEITTQIIVATERTPTLSNNTAISDAVKPVYETVSELKRTDKRNKKRRQYSDRNRNEARKLNNSQNTDQYGTNLEFSNSYTKRRTQGYNSEEESATTPISPIKLKHVVKHDIVRNLENTTSSTGKSEKVKHFQDTLTEQQSPHQIDYGHLTENPAGWEERYERKNLKSQRHQGRVKWGDRKGNFGEHYYDLNHHRTAKPSNHTRTAR